MKSFLTIFLFLGLTLFCVYWFGQKNMADRDFTKIPYIGNAATQIFYHRMDIWDYLSQGPGAIVQTIGDKINFK